MSDTLDKLPDGWLPAMNGGAILPIDSGLDPLVVQRKTRNGPWVASIRRKDFGPLASESLADACKEADAAFDGYVDTLKGRHASVRGVGEVGDE